MKQAVIIRFSILLIIGLICNVAGQVIFQDDFEYSDAFTNHGWKGSSEKFLHGTGRDGGKCVRVLYDEGGTAKYWFGKDVNGLSEFTVEFSFKIENTPAYGGCKFLKIFGKKKDDHNYANTTLQLDYWDGKLTKVYYGDGEGTGNDIQASIKYAGTASDGQVKVLDGSGNFTPQNNTWYTYRFYMKYNNYGQRDGEYRVWIDNKLRVHAVNVKNHHENNYRATDYIGLANYSDKSYREKNGNPTWYLSYDDVTIWRGLATPGGSGSGAVIQTATLPTPVVGVPYTHKLSAVGGATPYVWSVSGSMPAGMSLNPNLGLIYGTPNSIGNYNFTVALKDGDQNTDSRSFSWSVKASSKIIFRASQTKQASRASVNVYDIRGALLYSTRVATGLQKTGASFVDGARGSHARQFGPRYYRMDSK